ncbi:uncharacterized protein LOC141591604 isoform X2 [Silene latifolia]|uniref:uncharacterized protein LOC141591604 isoform X2 n=1 Tax=Silene latifolia TaxID=37657 RepID=UPI003D77B9BC
MHDNARRIIGHWLHTYCLKRKYLLNSDVSPMLKQRQSHQFSHRDLTAIVLWLHGCNKEDVAIHTENVFHLQKTQDLLRLGQQRRHLLTCRSHFATLTPKRYFVVSKRLMTGDISIVLLLCC